MSRTIDSIDRKVLAILQSNARTSNAEIARQVGLTPSAVLERIRKLERKGIIQGYHARIDPRAVELGLLAFLFVKSDEPYGTYEVGEALSAIPEVQEVHHITGRDCYLVKVRTLDPESLGHLCREKIAAIGTIESTNTTVVLGTLKESSSLPLPSEESDTRRASEAKKRGGKGGRS